MQLQHSEPRRVGTVTEAKARFFRPPASELQNRNETNGTENTRRPMTTGKHDSDTLFGIYKLHAELAEQVASSRESLNKLYSGMVTSIVAASVLLHRVAPDSDTVWVLPALGILVSLSWMLSLRSVTGRLSAKHAVLLKLEAELPFAFLKRENLEFEKLGIVRRKRSGLLMPAAFILVCGTWLTMLVYP